MRCRSWFILLIVSFSLGLTVPVLAAEEGARAGKLIDAFKRVKKEADAKVNAPAFAALDAFFDFDTFTASCVGKSAAKLNPAQAKEVQDRLRTVFRQKGYPAGGGFFATGQATLGTPGAAHGGVAVPIQVHFPKEDLTTEVSFVFGKDGRVIDIAIDGDSLARDYQNQIGRIVSKGGPEDLLKRLAEAQRSAEAGR